MEVEKGLEEKTSSNLLREARHLDRYQSQEIPEKLARLEQALSTSLSGPFHAAEESILRWLLKLMNGATSEAAAVRRLPMAWAVMARTFTRIPLFSLAKSLADRRFIGVLQDTLKDLRAAPNKGTATEETPDSVMAGSDVALVEQTEKPRKRKWCEFDGSEFDAPAGASACILTGQALIAALRILLSSLGDGSSLSQQMGAEHIKSLFCLPATETLNIVLPLLEICHLALDYGVTGMLHEPSSWMSTIETIWDLHLRSQSDYLEVAMLASLRVCKLLQKLTDGDESAALDSAIRQAWAIDLRQFLVANLIAPARADFLSTKKLDAIRMSITVADQEAPYTLPVLFDLVIRSSADNDGMSVKKSYEAWVHAVFEAVEEPIRDAPSSARDRAIKDMLAAAAEHGATLSMDSLKLVCRQYRIIDGGANWDILRLVAEVNAEVFLLPNDGVELLDEVLKQTERLEWPNDLEYGYALDFVLRLAQAFATARDLVGFIKAWYGHLPSVEANNASASGRGNIWLSRELSVAIADILPTSITAKQLSQLLDWLLENDNQAQNGHLAVILASIADAIRSEVFEDSVGLRLFEATFSSPLQRSASHIVSCARWHVARRTLSWTSLRDSTGVWNTIKADLAGTLEKEGITHGTTFEAFKCSIAAWLSFYSGAPLEEEAADLVVRFLDRIRPELSRDGLLKAADLETIDSSLQVPESQLTECFARSQTAPPDINVVWVLFRSPQLFHMLSQRQGRFPDVLQFLLDVSLNNGTKEDLSYRLCEAMVKATADYESNANDLNLTSGIVERLARPLDGPGPWSEPSRQRAARILLALPPDMIDRAQRERIMLSLVKTDPCSHESHVTMDFKLWKTFLSLMAKLMDWPTFYENMDPRDLIVLGGLVSKEIGKTNIDDLTSHLVHLQEGITLYEEVASKTFMQISSRLSAANRREQEYMKKAAVAIAACPVLPGRPDQVPWLILGKSFLQSMRSVANRNNQLLQPTMDEARKQLALIIKTTVEHCLNRWQDDSNLDQHTTVPLLLVALGTATNLEAPLVRDLMAPYVAGLGALSEKPSLAETGAWWKIKEFLVTYFAASDFLSSLDAAWHNSSDRMVSVGQMPPVRCDYFNLIHYVDVAIQNMDEPQKLATLKQLVSGPEEGPTISVTRYVAVYRVLEKLDGSAFSTSTTQADGFELATLHSLLCRQLVRADSASGLIAISRCLQLLLDKRSGAMSQWGIEVTLSSVSTIASQFASRDVLKSSTKIYDWLCRLIEIILKRHRIRLEGHFHLMIATLQSLLRTLLKNQPAETPISRLEKQARQYSRLLTLVCEPSAASVSRSQPNALDSATDAAKRSAGQHMYLVLLLYVRLQLEQAVPHGMRKALEPGLYAILDITTPEVRRIASEAMDANGRLIFRELYKEYVKFGKWTGV